MTGTPTLKRAPQRRRHRLVKPHGQARGATPAGEGSGTPHRPASSGTGAWVNAPAVRSARLVDEAKRYLVGGVNSPVRSFGGVGGELLLITQGRGAQLIDVDGRQYIDLIMGWGALLLGHAHPAVLRAAGRGLAHGTHFGLTHPSEAQLAKAITEAIPSIEQVRFTSSGTEACMAAIRLARACAGRTKILTFEGCYHGHSDGLLVKRGSGLATLGLAGSAGVPDPIAQETIVVPYNDLDALETVVTRYGPQLACAIIEPVAANMGVVIPTRDFLTRLRTLTARQGIALIFDEVVTGFRVAYGGAQDLFGITPDLTVLGKILGGGFPIGAFGGPRSLMQRLAPVGDVYHAGTFAGHPVAMTAGLATLSELKRSAPYRRLDELGDRLATGLAKAAARAGVPLQINRLGSMLTVFFSEPPVARFQDVQRTDRSRFARFANALRRAGVLLPPSPFEAWFLSVRHTTPLIDAIIERASHALATL